MFDVVGFVFLLRALDTVVAPLVAATLVDQPLNVQFALVCDALYTATAEDVDLVEDLKVSAVLVTSELFTS